ncbi:acyl-CoA dehydrogenase family protein [Bacillus dakarensis]|uniref:acyl-CoA dehydrogenase family protein n=1 Tax=Robertmurraya dakarensis TaxID=1926278 RepID=UPI0009816C33|nr:acyl-CoA dehydrogenase family protein [Bacillus dakarensis]
MNFDFTDEQVMLKKTMKKFVREVLEPAIEEQGHDKPLSKEFILSMMKELKPFGLLSTTIPEEQGGAGMDTMTWALMYEELPGELSGYAGISPNVARSIAHGGSDYHKEKFLPGLLAGDKIACSANTEPNVGSDTSGMQTTAYLDGDHWVINGTKTFITNGNHADYISVTVQFDKSKGGKGLGTILIDREETPVESRRIELMGLKTGDLAELYFDNVRVPKENLLVPEGEGLVKNLKGYHAWRCFVAAKATTIAEKALEYSLKYVNEREQFGKKIGSFQLVQEMLADMKTEIDASRLLTYRALDMVNKGKHCRVETSMAKQFATEMAIRVTSKAIQIHGAYGLTSEFPLERLFRNARILTIPEGTTQIQKLVIGRELTGLNAIRK